MMVHVTIIEHFEVFGDVAGPISRVAFSDGRVFTIGTPVRKRTGYPFPGIVISMYALPNEELRCVVYCTAKAVEGMQHIFNFDQLEPV